MTQLNYISGNYICAPLETCPLICKPKETCPLKLESVAVKMPHLFWDITTTKMLLQTMTTVLFPLT